ncbi:MAG: transglycosylase domain-containing protein [Clostridia bacterium]|nr:transglycosylase domain-containing protein [Clostridia bacterium]
MLFAFGYYFAVTSSVSLESEKLSFREENITVYDSHGVPVDAFMQNGETYTVPYTEIPKHTRQAFIDTEDKRFFSHNGYDYRRVIKAVLNNLKSGRFEQGASTISQQLIKNTHLSQEKTLKRKLKEWKLTRQLERKYSKQEILEKYLSVIYFGHNCFGLRSAAKFYFGKDVNELDLADSAILAGLVKSPNNYSPFKNPENCIKRKAVVLSLMAKNGSITEAERQAALHKALPNMQKSGNQANGYLHFVFDELSTLAQEYAFTVGGNIQIYTQYDANLQNALQELANGYTQSDKTLSVLDAKTHAFKACVSSVGDIRRLPGSLLKPLLVYAPALEENLISPATPILDEKINYAGYAPNNFDGKFHGYLSARECVAKSLNIPAVKTLDALGIEKGAQYLQKLGLGVDKDDYSLALALGGMKNGYTLNSLLAAYSCLTNAGVYSPCGFITEIKIDGNRVFARTQKNSRVFSEESAYLMTNMLKTAATTGTAKKLRALPFAIAAKTGTVGTDKGNTDAYALSYTTNDIVGVWLGNADNRFIDCTGGGLPCNLLLNINEYLYKNNTPNDFKKASGVLEVSLDKPSYYDTHTILLADNAAPAEYRFNELFKKQCVPKTKSEMFSNPVIIQPTVRFDNGKIVIEFHESSPEFYQYKIERYDYSTNTTVYFGAYTQLFTDENILPNKKYIYTVKPVYNGRAGKAIILPTVSTANGESPPNEEILDKDWWKY